MQSGKPSKARGAAVSPLEIHLDLDELIDLNIVVEHAASGLIQPGSVLQRDPSRPKKTLAIVQDLFSGLGHDIHIRLGKGPAGRYLKARFAWRLSPDYGGVAADGVSRTRVKKFTLADPKQDKGVTAYVFEGVIASWIMEHFGSKPIAVNNIFASFIAHELGHNLGLEHAYSPRDIMFIYNEQPRDAQRLWLSHAANKSLRFKGWQVQKMRLLLDKP